MSCPLFCVCDKCATRIGREHELADERCGRTWVCQCGSCRRAREVYVEIDAAFARAVAADNALRDHYRSVLGHPPGKEPAK